MNDLSTYDDAVALAEALNARLNEGEPRFVPIDRGSHRSPRYDAIQAPAVGDAVSYAFNGDYYPDGEIVRITKSGRVITSGGHTYYPVVTREHGRQIKDRRTGGYRMKGGTWSLVKGHHDRRNPHF